MLLCLLVFPGQVLVLLDSKIPRHFLLLYKAISMLSSHLFPALATTRKTRSKTTRAQFLHLYPNHRISSLATGQALFPAPPGLVLKDVSNKHSWLVERFLVLQDYQGSVDHGVVVQIMSRCLMRNCSRYASTRMVTGLAEK